MKEAPMSTRKAVVLAVTLTLAAGAARADRLNDEQVKKLIEDIDAGYKTWKQDLERENLDDAVIRSSERTVKVKDFLKDFDQDIDTLKSRFKPSYAASPEVIVLLRRGSDVELRNRRQNLTPRSAWSVLSTKLTALASAYELPFPVESMDAQAVRLNDGELATKLQQTEQAFKQLKGETDKAAKANKAIDKATRESLKTSIQKLEQSAKDVGSRVKDDRPATTEVNQLLSGTGQLKQTLTKLSLPTSGGGSWAAIESGTDALARAYDQPRP
jgi:hypothetical protein